MTTARFSVTGTNAAEIEARVKATAERFFDGKPYKMSVDVDEFNVQAMGAWAIPTIFTGTATITSIQPVPPIPFNTGRRI